MRFQSQEPVIPAELVPLGLTAFNPWITGRKNCPLNAYKLVIK